MVGSDQVVFESIIRVLELVGSDIIHCGDVGSGQFTKILNNMVLFQNVLALSEASKIAERYNLDCGQLFQNISKCSGDSFALKNHGLKSIIKDNYPNPAFSVKYAQKDLSYAIDLAKKQNINVSREILAEGNQNESDLRKVDVQITRIRQKIENNPKKPHFIQTVRGKGYRLVTD